MSSGDLLEDLRSNRQRAVVPDRNDPLLPKPSDVQQTPEPTFDLDYPDELTKTLIDPVPSQSEPSTSACDRFGEEERGGGLVPTDKSGGINDSPKSPPPLSQAFLGELNNYPDKLRRLTVRLDEEVCLKLDSVCSRQTLTAETLIESLLCQCDANPNLMKKVVKDAKERYKKRKQAGVKKRVASMQQKYGD